MKRRFLLLLFATLLVTGCEKTPEKETATKTEVYVFDEILDLCIYNTDTLNPLATSVKHNAEVLSVLYDSLFSVRSDFSATADLCKSITVSKSGLTLTITPLEHVFFQNGAPVTAKDIVASIRTILSSDGYYKQRLPMIKGASEKDGKVEIYLFRPTENITALLDFPILPDGGAGFSEETDFLGSVIPGSGLFSVSEYRANKEIRLVANMAHHSEVVPPFNEVVIHFAPDKKTARAMLENGQIDMLKEDAVFLSGYTMPSFVQSINSPGLDCVFLGINPAYDEHSANILNAVSAVIDREKLIALPGIYATAAHDFVHPARKQKNVQSTISPSDAAALFASFGWHEQNSDGMLYKTVSGKTKKVILPILFTNESNAKRQIAEEIASQLLAFGIKVTLEPVSPAAFLSRIASGDYTLFIGSVSLLPNFDSADLKSLLKLICPAAKSEDTLSDTPDIFPFSALYFEDEILLSHEKIRTKISTENPYKSIQNFTISP